MVDLKKAESVSAIHLINAARLGNSKAGAVLRTGGSALVMLVERHLKSDLLFHKLNDAVPVETLHLPWISSHFDC